MTAQVRRLLAMLLLLALPLQGQAVSSMNCHSTEHNGHPVSLVSDAGQDGAIQHLHDTPQSETTTQQPGSCALCVGSCAMAHAIPAAPAGLAAVPYSNPISALPTPRYLSVVLEGLLRPPRS